MSKKKKPKPERISWKDDVAGAILKALEENPEDRFPTIRSVWYFLWSALQLIPGTEGTYKKVDEVLVNLRKDGHVEFGRFEVARGQSGSGGSVAIEPEWYVQNRIEKVINLAEDYELPHLYDQPYLIEVWVEKRGLIRSFEKICNPFDIKVRSPEGFTPWEFTHSVIEDLDSYFRQRQSEHLKIRYFGDQDPSGLSIYNSLLDQLNYFKVDYEASRAGVTIDHIRDFNLPETPLDRETLEKIRRDSRYPKYVEQFGEVFCELDAFISLAYDDFKNLVETGLNDLIDQGAVDERDAQNDNTKERIRNAIEPEQQALDEIKNRIIERLSEEE